MDGWVGGHGERDLDRDLDFRSSTLVSFLFFSRDGGVLILCRCSLKAWRMDTLIRPDWKMNR